MVFKICGDISCGQFDEKTIGKLAIHGGHID